MKRIISVESPDKIFTSAVFFIKQCKIKLGLSVKIWKHFKLRYDSKANFKSVFASWKRTK